MKKYSLLGLALTGAAGLTAAFIPAQKTEAKSSQAAANGWLTASTDDGNIQTCIAFELDPEEFTPNCNYTATGISATSNAQNTHSNTGGIQNDTVTGTSLDEA